MRLIDADALIDTLGISDEDIEFKEMLEYAPLVDAVEVVRCKDCKFYQPFDPYRKYDCNRGLLGVMGDDYCSYGERR